MDKFVVIFILTVSVLLITADINVEADEDDSDTEETGWFVEFCSWPLATEPGGVACYLITCILTVYTILQPEIISVTGINPNPKP